MTVHHGRARIERWRRSAWAATACAVCCLAVGIPLAWSQSKESGARLSGELPLCEVAQNQVVLGSSPGFKSPPPRKSAPVAQRSTNTSATDPSETVTVKSTQVLNQSSAAAERPGNRTPATKAREPRPAPTRTSSVTTALLQVIGILAASVTILVGLLAALLYVLRRHVQNSYGVLRPEFVHTKNQYQDRGDLSSIQSGASRVAAARVALGPTGADLIPARADTSEIELAMLQVVFEQNVQLREQIGELQGSTV